MKKIKWLFAVGCFLILFLALQRLVMPKYTEEMVEGGFTSEYYRETEPHQVLMVGDCELYENFSTIKLWEKYGITSYIRGNAQQLPWQSYYMLEDALKYETPLVVVFNVQELKYNEPQREEYNRMALDGMRWSAVKVKAIQASQMEGEHMADYVFPLLRFHSRITNLDKSDIKNYFTDKTRTHAGYYMRVDVMPYEDGIWEEEKPDSFEFGDRAMGYLDKIADLCEEKGIRLLLVKAPSRSPLWYDEWDRQVRTYAEKRELDYINFLDHVDEIGINYDTDTYDQGLHMNLSGAEKCADYLGKFLSENYMLKNMRNNKEIKKVWDEKTKFYYKMKKAQQEELEKYGELINY